MVIVDQLTKNYGDFHLDVSFEIPDGTVSGIVGKNGAGKSTTIKAVLGLIRPDSGHVAINGKDVSKLTGAEKESIGVALSDSGFSGYLNIEDVICILKNMYSSFDEPYFRKCCSVVCLCYFYIFLAGTNVPCVLDAAEVVKRLEHISQRDLNIFLINHLVLLNQLPDHIFICLAIF